MLSMTLDAVLVAGITAGLTKFALVVVEWMLQGGFFGLATGAPVAVPRSFFRRGKTVFSSGMARV